VTGFELEARVSGWKRSASAFGQLGQLPESLSTSIDNWRSLGHFRVRTDSSSRSQAACQGSPGCHARYCSGFRQAPRS
jgi:hypothetical protein